MRAAVQEMIDRQDWLALVDYVEANWVELTQSGRDVLALAFNALPDEIVSANARLAAARDWVNFAPTRGGARTTRYQHTPVPATGLLDTLASLTSQSAGARMAGQFEAAVAAVREAQQTIHDVPATAIEPFRAILPDLRLQWALSLELGGHLQDATLAYERTYDEALRFGNIRIAVEAAGTIAFNHALTGMPARARHWLTRIPHSDTISDRDTVQVMRGLAEALLAAGRLRLDEARTIIAGMPDEDVSPETWVARLVVETTIDALAGGGEIAATRISGAKATHLPATWATGLNGALMAIADARAALGSPTPPPIGEAVQRISRAEATSLRHLTATIGGWWELRQGSLSRALRIAADAIGADRLEVGIAAELRAILALASLALGDEASAVGHYRVCVAIVLPDRMFAILHHMSVAERDELNELAGIALPPEALAALAGVPALPALRRSPVVLSRREKIILGHLVDGGTMSQIAVQEHVSVNTVKTQIRSLYKKLGVDDREGAARAAAANPRLLA